MYSSSLKFSSRDSKQWNTSGIEGVHRFLGRAWRLVVGSPLSDGTLKEGTVVTDEDPTPEQLRSLHKCIAKVQSLLGLYLFIFFKSGVCSFTFWCNCVHLFPNEFIVFYFSCSILLIFQLCR